MGNIVNRNSKLLLSVAVAALFASGLTSCSSGGGDENRDCVPQNEVDTIESGKLTVAAHVYMPFSDIEGENLSGFEGDLITKIAALECLTVVPMQVPIPSVVSSVTTGRADTAIGTWYRTAERQEIVTLGDPIISDSMAFVVREGVDVETVGDLVGKRVGSAIGYLWDTDLSDLLGGDLTAYSDLQSVYADFEANRIDVIVDTAPSAGYRLKDADMSAQIVIPPADDRIGASKQPGQTQFMSSLDNPELAEVLSKHVAAFRADGTLNELLEKWGLPLDIGDPGEPSLL